MTVESLSMHKRLIHPASIAEKSVSKSRDFTYINAFPKSSSNTSIQPPQQKIIRLAWPHQRPSPTSIEWRMSANCVVTWGILAQTAGTKLGKSPWSNFHPLNQSIAAAHKGLKKIHLGMLEGHNLRWLRFCSPRCCNSLPLGKHLFQAVGG